MLLWPFFFFVEHGAMNSNCSVLMKICTSRKLDAECYYVVITFLLAFGAKVLYPFWLLRCGVGHDCFGLLLRAMILMRIWDVLCTLCSLGCIAEYGMLTYRCGSSIVQQNV